jgi:hypothetical protein
MFRKPTSSKTDGTSESAAASWSAVTEMRGRSLASAAPLSSSSGLTNALTTFAKRCRASLTTALQDAAGRVICIGLILSCALILTACLDFGEKNEWFAPEVTQAHLQEISSITLIQLPLGAEGLAYLVDNSGIDGALAAKLRIPPEKETELLSSEVFTKGENEAPTQGIGLGSAWWKAESLSNPISRTIKIKGNQYLGCIYGKEGSDHILYITWFDT